MHDHHHDHSHEPFESPGDFALRESVLGNRDFSQRAFTVGVGGPVGTGKTALVRVLCEALRKRYSLGVVTNDIFTREALEADRIIGVETGGCPHAAIREDISLNLNALEDLRIRFACDIDLLFVESGGDNLAAHFSKELVDYAIYVIDVSAGDKIPRKGGPGITQSDLLVINKTDLAGLVGADLGVMARDAKKMRGDGPTLFACLKHGSGLDEIIEHVLHARRSVLSPQPR